VPRAHRFAVSNATEPHPHTSQATKLFKLEARAAIKASNTLKAKK
jgi:hypothetical protein